jgi:SRSO17 transposase
MKPSQDITYDETLTTTTEVVQWVQALTELHDRIAPYFARSEPRSRALGYLKGIMSEIPRKNGWQLAEHAREATPYGMQRLLAEARWDDSLVRVDLRDYVYEHLGTPDAIGVLDETSFPKRGDKSAGVQKQYCGTTGQIENCQVAVFLDYATERGHTLIDVELYVPEAWINDRERCREAGIPDTVGFQTKCELARLLVERIYKAQIPLSWIAADTVYGNNLDLRMWLEDHGYFFVLAVECREPVAIRTPDGVRRQVEAREVEALMISAQDWQRLSMGDGTKGPRRYDWACVPILHQWVDDGKHWVLIRRCIDDPTIKTYYFVFGPPNTSLHVMVKVIGTRWRIEDDFQTGKALGLAQYQVRCFTGWYRHVTLVMLAHAFLAVICAKKQNITITDADPPDSPSTAPVVDASPPLPSVPAMIPAQSASLPLSVHAPALFPERPSPLPISSVLAMIPVSTSSRVPALLPERLSFAHSAISPPSLSLAPLTIPEVRHLLATLIWPASTNPRLVLECRRMAKTPSPRFQYVSYQTSLGHELVALPSPHHPSIAVFCLPREFPGKNETLPGNSPSSHGRLSVHADQEC